MIEIKNLTKNYDGVPALAGLGMTVPTGAVYGLVGPNGAGKSTAIRHLAGILRPDGGEVLFDGEPVWENPAVKARVAYIPDEIWHFTQANVGDMAKFYRGACGRFDRERFEKLGEAFGLSRRGPMRRFSRGMKKQAAFWLALSCRPDWLLLDEPMDGLDPVMRRQVWSLVMADVAERGMTVLVSSHNLRELEEVCDHVGIMYSGRMLAEKSVECGAENLESLFMKELGGEGYDVKDISF